MLNTDLNNYIFLVFIIINFFLFKNLNLISQKIKIVDNPNHRKIHKKSVPILGGIFLIINFLLYFIIFNDEIILISTNKSLIIGVILFFIIGIFDDQKPIGSIKKLIISFFFIFLILFIDDFLLIKNLQFSFLDQKIGLKGFSYIFTVLCFLLFINAFNMFDGINCQTSFYSIFLIVNLIFYNSYNSLLLVLLIFLLFFSYNNYNTKIFLGDGGSLALGFIFSYLFVKNYNLNNISYSDEIFLLMFLPGIDMFRLYIQRLLNKKNPFSPDRNHLHHYLLEKYKLKNTLIIQGLIICLPLLMYKLSLHLFFCNLLGLSIYVFVLLILFRSKLKC